jgi:hypothetical protein
MNVVLRECSYELQRTIDLKHVTILAEYMRRGLWRPKDQLAFARLNGKLILINGYHRANAQIASGKNVEWSIAIHDCTTTEQVRALYHRFDTNLRKRSDQSILKGVGFSEEFGLAPLAASCLYKAVPIIANGLSVRAAGADSDIFTRSIVDDRLKLAKEYVRAASAFEFLMKPAPRWLKKKVQNGGIYAVAMVTMRLQPTEASEFWGGIAENDGLRRGDPRMAFLNDLADRNLHTGTVAQSVVVPALAWNAHWDQRDLKVIKVHPGRKTKLQGTPYTVTG